MSLPFLNAYMSMFSLGTLQHEHDTKNAPIFSQTHI